MNNYIIFLERFECLKCPDDSENGSMYPNCSCDKVGQYNPNTNQCTKCPQGSIGIFPKCECTDELFVFDEFQVKCNMCPSGSSGKIPECKCDNGAGKWSYIRSIFTI